MVRRRHHRPARSWPARIWGWAWKSALGFVLLSVAWVGLYAFVPPPITMTMLGDRFAGRNLQRDWMPLDEIDPDMARAVIAAEDSKFCSHDGFDVEAIGAAYIEARNGGRRRGGSTISQQTAKNAFLWQGGGWFRKGVEAYFTVLVEALWSKRRIMEVYLNIAETGIGTYGVNAGAQRYFKTDASSLTPMQAARIAAVLPLPKKRAAVDPKGFTRRYGGIVTRRMGVVRREGLDGCLRLAAGGAEPAAKTPIERIEDVLDKAGRLPTIPVEELAPEPTPEPIAAPETRPLEPAEALVEEPTVEPVTATEEPVIEPDAEKEPVAEEPPAIEEPSL